MEEEEGRSILTASVYSTEIGQQRPGKNACSTMQRKHVNYANVDRYKPVSKLVFLLYCNWLSIRSKCSVYVTLHVVKLY